LGQNVLERNYLGLMTKTHTFNDLSEADLAATSGARYAKGLRDEVFKHSNPYRLVEVSDHFGKHAQTPNPPSDHELRHVTIDKAYWPDEAVPEVRSLGLEALERVPGFPIELLSTNARFFIHCREWLDGAGDYLQYKLFMRRADPSFVLRTKDRPDVSCHISTSFYTHRSRNLCELEIVIPPSEFAKMAPGVPYTLHPVNGKPGYAWSVRDGVTLMRK
jgi:hypothetical protein